LVASARRSWKAPRAGLLKRIADEAGEMVARIFTLAKGQDLMDKIENSETRR